MERQLSIASGTNPVNNTVDDMRRQNLYERLSRFYSIVDKGRLNKGIGDVIEYGLQKGEQEMSSRLSEKYGMSLNQFEEEEVMSYILILFRSLMLLRTNVLKLIESDKRQQGGQVFAE